MGGAKSTTAALVSYVTTTGHAAHWMAYVFLISLLGGNFAEGASYKPTNFNLCGDSFIDADGLQWYGKNFITPSSSGNSCINTLNPIAIDTEICAAPDCQQTQLQQMFQYSQTAHNLTYTNLGVGNIGKQNTIYLVTLYFAEYTATAVGQRVFSVSINSVTVVTNVDIYAITGGQDRALSLSYEYYSGTRSNFDISLPTTAGLTSILAGLSFGWATNTSITYLPSSTTVGGAAVTFQAVTISLNPNLLNVTDGNMTFYINGVYFMSTTVVVQLDGTVLASVTGSSTTFCNCSGGTFTVTATYSGSFAHPVLMYSSNQATFSLAFNCLTTTPESTTTTPATTSTPAPTTTPATTTSNPPTITPTLSTTPATTTSTTPTTTAAPSTTPALVTSTPLASTTPPPTTGNVEITMTAEFSPNPPLPGQPLTISGAASASSGPAPTGNVTVYVDRLPVATVPVVPESGSGRRLLAASSLFSVTIIAPSTPGVHVITAVFTPASGGSGGGKPIVAPVVVTIEVEGCKVAVAISSPALQFPSCTDPLRVTASVTASNGTAPPNGVVTLSISGLYSPAIGATPLNVTLASANISGGAAVFDLQPRSHMAAAVQALAGAGKAPSVQLLPGSYQLTASYSGDALYGPTSGNASLDVDATCHLVSLSAESGTQQIS